MDTPTFLSRVMIKNYKSIAACDVALGPLTFLVGQNGAGKSNFLDALRLITDGLRTNLDYALRDRGGINEVRRRSGGHPNNFGIRLDFTLPSGAIGHYAFRIGARPQGGYEVQAEECRVVSPDDFSDNHYFSVDKGMVDASMSIMPAVSTDRLYLVNASGLRPFAPVYEALSNMGFYNLNPASIRAPQSPDAGHLLKREGENIASVLAQLQSHNPQAKERIEEYLGNIVPGLSSVEAKQIGTMETLQFRQGVAGAGHPWRFHAANMSDGTLRGLGILVALFQSATTLKGDQEVPRIPLVGIEEPEVALHPAAAGLVLDALREASNYVQVIVTSHSPDLLDDAEIDSDSILAVQARKGITHIGRLDAAGRSMLKDELYTVGELLRLNQLEPDPKEITKVSSSQLQLFGDSEFEKGATSDFADSKGSGDN